MRYQLPHPIGKNPENLEEIINPDLKIELIPVMAVYLNLSEHTVDRQISDGRIETGKNTEYLLCLRADNKLFSAYDFDKRDEAGISMIAAYRTAINHFRSQGSLVAHHHDNTFGWYVIGEQPRPNSWESMFKWLISPHKI